MNKDRLTDRSLYKALVVAIACTGIGMSVSPEVVQAEKKKPVVSVATPKAATLDFSADLKLILIGLGGGLLIAASTSPLRRR